MRNKGSITVFSTISLMLITAALFSMLEGTRLQEMRRLAELQTISAIESVFANYNLTLWENYHLLGTDTNEMEERLETYANGRVGGEDLNLLSFRSKSSKVKDYTLLTDGDGKVFMRSVSTYMKENFLYEAAKEIYNQYESIKAVLNTISVDSAKIDEAIKEIEEAAKSAPNTSVGSSGTTNTETPIDVLGILKEVKKWKENGILQLVIKDTSKLSSSTCDFSNGLLSRELKTGTKESKEEITWMDRILLQQYLLTYMSNYRDTKKGRALSYELEYLLCEKNSDKQNLQMVVTELLAIREAANFLYLISDPVKSQQALALATMISGATGTPVMIEVIKIGLITAWAFAESVLDVRALLAGKHIPLLKSEESWTVELEKLGFYTQGFCIAKDCTWGLSYEHYLGALLLFKEEENLAMHTLSIQEASVRKSGNSTFQMDCCMIEVGVEVLYKYKPVFPFLRVLDTKNKWNYAIKTHARYGYYE